MIDVLFGDYNPRLVGHSSRSLGSFSPIVSGRLPYTIAKSANDYSAQVTYSSPSNPMQINYTEGLFIDYRHFDAVSVSSFVSTLSLMLPLQANIAPRFEFGFGLSYTTFAYSDLSISGSVAGGQPKTGYGASLDAKYAHALT